MKITVGTMKNNIGKVLFYLGTLINNAASVNVCLGNLKNGKGALLILKYLLYFKVKF